MLAPPPLRGRGEDWSSSPPPSGGGDAAGRKSGRRGGGLGAGITKMRPRQIRGRFRLRHPNQPPPLRSGLVRPVLAPPPLRGGGEDRVSRPFFVSTTAKVEAKTRASRPYLVSPTVKVGETRPSQCSVAEGAAWEPESRRWGRFRFEATSAQPAPSAALRPERPVLAPPPLRGGGEDSASDDCPEG